MAKCWKTTSHTLERSGYHLASQVSRPRYVYTSEPRSFLLPALACAEDHPIEELHLAARSYLVMQCHGHFRKTQLVIMFPGAYDLKGALYHDWEAVLSRSTEFIEDEDSDEEDQHNSRNFRGSQSTYPPEASSTYASLSTHNVSANSQCLQDLPLASKSDKAQVHHVYKEAVRTSPSPSPSPEPSSRASSITLEESTPLTSLTTSSLRTRPSQPKRSPNSFVVQL